MKLKQPLLNHIQQSVQENQASNTQPKSLIHTKENPEIRVQVFDEFSEIL